MNADVAIKCLKVEKGCVNIDCNYCTEHNKCYLQQLIEENETQKEYIKDLQTRKDRYYLQVLEYEKQVSDWIGFYIKVRDIISGNYKILDHPRLQELRRIISEVTND